MSSAGNFCVSAASGSTCPHFHVCVYVLSGHWSTNDSILHGMLTQLVWEEKRWSVAGVREQRARNYSMQYNLAVGIGKQELRISQTFITVIIRGPTWKARSNNCMQDESASSSTVSMWAAFYGESVNRSLTFACCTLMNIAAHCKVWSEIKK